MPFYFKQKAGRANKSRGGFFRIMGLTGVLARILLLTMLPVPAEAGLPPAIPYSLTLSWDPSTSPDVVGYRVYYGIASGNYSNNIAVTDATTVTVSNLLPGVTYYFAATTIGADGQESSFSSEISYQRPLPGAQMQIQALAGGQFGLIMNGSAGHTYDIEATSDFSTWTIIGTVTLDASGGMNFTDTNAANFPQRFYRTHDTQP